MELCCSARLGWRERWFLWGGRELWTVLCFSTTGLSRWSCVGARWLRGLCWVSVLVCARGSHRHIWALISRNLSRVATFKWLWVSDLEPKYQRRKIACVGGSLEENIWVTSATQQNRWFNVFRTYHFFVQLSALQTECFCDFFFF